MEELSVTTVPLGDNVDGIQFANIYRVFLLLFISSGKKYVTQKKKVPPTIGKEEWKNKLEGIHVIYTPTSVFTNQFIDTNFIAYVKHVTVEGVTTEEEMQAKLESNPTSIGIVLHFSEDRATLRYDLRNYRTWRTATLYDPPSTSEESSNKYLTNALASAQMAVNGAFISRQTGSDLTTFIDELYLQAFPYPEYSAYERNMDATALSHDMILDMIIYIVILTVLVSSIILIVNVIAEKESGVKEMLKLSGVEEWLIWIGWFVNAFAVTAVSLTMIAVMLKYPFHGSDSESIRFVSFFVLWWVMMLFCTANISYCFMFCAIFHSARLALSMFLVSSAIITMGMIFYLEKIEINYAAMISCILPVGAFIQAFKKIRYFENLGVSFSWVSITFAGEGTDVSLSFVYFMLMFDTFFYSLLTFYITVINPGRFGVGKSPYFGFESLFFPFEDDTIADELAQVQLNSSFFEDPPSNLKTSIQITKLAKNYDNVRVIKRVDLNVYRGEITAILGRNGSGKTTLTSILTGLTAPTIGSVQYEGMDVLKNMKMFRKYLGLCPQENRVITYLTVVDHLWLFSKLKNIPDERIVDITNYYLDVFDMNEHSSTAAGYLNHSMKRKLCILMSLLGDPEILILDEPTSGVDVQSRRKIWNLLLTLRKNHTVILTTHFMEEADALGDRIAIIHQGIIVCHGTPIFLKKQYGTGYDLTITKSFDDGGSLNNAVVEYLPSAVKEFEGNNQVVFKLPLTETASFPALFRYLERHKSLHGILTMRMSSKTMEQVFLKVGGVTDYKSVKFRNENQSSEMNFLYDHQQVSSKMLLFIRQMTVLLQKKYVYTKRTFASFFLRIILPSLFLLAVLRALVGTRVLIAEPRLEFSLKTYPEMKVVSILNDEPLRLDAQRIFMDFVESEGAKVTNLSHRDVIEVLLENAKKDIISYNRNLMIALELNKSTVKLLYNNVGIHSLPIALNAVYNTALEMESEGLNEKPANKTYEIHAANKPVFQSVKPCGQKDAHELFSAIWFFVMAFYTIDVISYFSIFINRERTSGFRHIQLMYNVSPYVYWLSTLIFDLALFLLIIISRMILFSLFDDEFHFLAIDESASVMFILMVAYGISGLLFVYVISFLTTLLDDSYPVVFILNFFICYTAWLFYSFQISSLTVPGVIKLESSIVTILGFYLAESLTLFLPPLNFSLLFYKFIKIWSINTSCWTCPHTMIQNCQDNLTKGGVVEYLEYESEKNPNGMLKGIHYLFIDAIIYGIILILIIQGRFSNSLNEWKKRAYGVYSSKKDEGDSDVAAERERVKDMFKDSSGSHHEVLVADGLRKNYTKFFNSVTAVHDVTFAVPHGECFGILGLNGAGKTTTFQMLAGEKLPTIGDAVIEGYSLIRDTKKYLGMTGYCPQRNSLIEELTGREILTFIAALRGVAKKDILHLVDQWINALGLTQNQNQMCGNYSQGNKRKLCTALALIGNFQVVLLDEPTSGVDVVSKQQLYEIITQSKQIGRTIVVSSHSMEECEILCDRITIMTGGVMRCIGTVEHLKSKYAQGFSVVIKLRHDVESYQELNKLKSDMLYIFTPEYCSLKDEYGGLLNYQITDLSIPWSLLFQRMEYIKAINWHLVYDYVLRDTTLEDVFFKFVQKELYQELED